MKYRRTTKFQVVQVRFSMGTGSISLLLQLLFGANDEGSGSSAHVEGFARYENDNMKV